MAKGTKRATNAGDLAVMIDDVEELADIIACLKEEGKVVVFTNGTFDLLHVGHIRCLKDARSRGDYLVVAVNSDASVRKYKNPKLPIQKFEERKEIIAALRWVDYVIGFEDATCDELIAALKPSIVAKGTDYTEDSVPERETIASVGASIAIVGDPKDHASSKLIQRIRRLKF
ncbi:MAG: adenylyltransferase/cytidyltransferase family protein [Planctomycetota bacterium]